ncbi:HAD family hydrolase [Zhihengliuella halotolerans]|uniref:HAD family hydrolase n=1 Tax=Zhihengliuella halotolerans TaxID=370736 RepID=UPI000C80040E|nr:HAD family hydrolase [Zhihengliuella halotolerans]
MNNAHALRNVPDALLLDFGGVVFETRKHPDGRDRMAASLAARLERAHLPADRTDLRRSLDAGLTALKHWKHAQSRRLAPTEMGPREVVADFLAADLPAPARALLTAEASDVLAELNTTLSAHDLRPGIRELLDIADARGIPVGIVSNAHSGRSHRRILADHGLEGRFGIQCYSDEVGLRKPHPGIIELAARGLGVAVERCWYVGDTQDRDVVAGRRAGVAAVVLTRSHHTDEPPFAVADTPDAVFDTPEGLARALRAAQGTTTAPSPRAPAVPVSAREPGVVDPVRGALLIDHGGVISASAADPQAMDRFAGWLSDLLAGTEAGPDTAGVLTCVEAARSVYRDFKRDARTGSGPGARIPEVDAPTFWRDWFGAGLSDRQRAVLTAEAHDVMARYGAAKSRRELRTGVAALLEACAAAGRPVVVVSNTVSGRAVRAVCAEHGIDHLIAAYVCSDEAGARKPDAALVREALSIAAADPGLSWFYGDKPQNDAVAAHTCGIGRRVLVRGGSTADPALEAALAEGLVTDVVDDADGLARLMGAVPALAR